MHRLVQAVTVETLSPELQAQWQKRVEYMDFISETDLGYALASMFYEWHEDDASEELSKVVTILTPPPPDNDTTD
jgi:hypothetical protein